jgi:hypothetical protein
MLWGLVDVEQLQNIFMVDELHHGDLALYLLPHLRLFQKRLFVDNLHSNFEACILVEGQFHLA